MSDSRARVIDAAAERAPARIAVERYAGGRDEWDTFVRGSAGGTFFHLIGWKEVLERSFGFESHYLIARRGGSVVGVLPLFELHAPLMPRCLLSLPFAVEAGVCAAEAEAQQALDQSAVALARARKAQSLELRDGRIAPGFRLREGRYYRFTRPLADGDAENFAAIPSKRRNMIRRAQRCGLVSRTGSGDLPAFHDLYARTAGRFGTPPFPLRYFVDLVETFPGETELLTVWAGGVPAAAGLLIFFGDRVSPYYVGSRRDFFRHAINDFLFWEVMCFARRRGARCFDFGRSKVGTGAFEYKKLWGFEPEPLRYRVHTEAHDPAPERSSADPKLRHLQRAWSRLPLPVMKALGPFFLKRWGPYYT